MALLQPVDWASRLKAIQFSWLGLKLSSVARSIEAQLMIFLCLSFSVVLFDDIWLSSRLVACYICEVFAFASS